MVIVSHQRLFRSEKIRDIKKAETGDAKIDWVARKISKILVPARRFELLTPRV